MASLPGRRDLGQNRRCWPSAQWPPGGGCTAGSCISRVCRVVRPHSPSEPEPRDAAAYQMRRIAHETDALLPCHRHSPGPVLQGVLFHGRGRRLPPGQRPRGRLRRRDDGLRLAPRARECDVRLDRGQPQGRHRLRRLDRRQRPPRPRREAAAQRGPGAGGQQVDRRQARPAVRRRARPRPEHPRGAQLWEQRHPAAQHPAPGAQQVAPAVRPHLAPLHPRGAAPQLRVRRLVPGRGRARPARRLQRQHHVLLRPQRRRRRLREPVGAGIQAARVAARAAAAPARARHEGDPDRPRPAGPDREQAALGRDVLAQVRAVDAPVPRRRRRRPVRAHEHRPLPDPRRERHRPGRPGGLAQGQQHARDDGRRRDLAAVGVRLPRGAARALVQADAAAEVRRQAAGGQGQGRSEGRKRRAAQGSLERAVPPLADRAQRRADVFSDSAGAGVQHHGPRRQPSLEGRLSGDGDGYGRCHLSG